MVALSQREMGAVLAGLKLLQHMWAEGRYRPDGIDALADNGGAFKALSIEEIDDLFGQLSKCL